MQNYLYQNWSIYCLIPDPLYNYDKEDQLSHIQEINGESQQEKDTRKFLNILTKNTIKKETVEKNVKGFVYKINPIDEICNDQNENNNTKDELLFLKDNYPGFILVKIFVPGDSFGEISLITSKGRTATLVSKEESHVMILNKASFDKVLGSIQEAILYQFEQNDICNVFGYNFFEKLKNQIVQF
ncbi:hypothetical protein IMG5_152940 [Ichthyophthirius multifiliis]|uniref:Cyclic nucleotide-binding domain-containing protein n=1 Tax=Ichthyophthirius multifiliis TaxID=5932 RepID=G0QYW8_ICHMU|nr:hypothetical protein IMG5_152940 [Ichthyophthirius multifiliis]EGR29583.1 hypothetical protein IMG5_152940 [Ichthyophthirius multifiliis]|eukprot:XP_004030819.1 hypothetical protein IMG5_152940 [Ichthyophthirius multifiliis]